MQERKLSVSYSLYYKKEDGKDIPCHLFFFEELLLLPQILPSQVSALTVFIYHTKEHKKAVLASYMGA